MEDNEMTDKEGHQDHPIVEHRLWSKCPHDGKYQDHADSVCFLTCPDSISVPCFKRWDRKEMEMLEAMDRA